MSEWKKVKLGDVVSIKSGLSYKSEFIGQGNNLLLGMGCVSYKENFLDSGVRPYSQDCDPKYLAAPGDLVLATRQQSDNLPILAMPAIIPDKYQGKKIIIGTNLYRVENNSDIENKFLFFVLKSHDYVNYIRGVKTGTTVQMVSKRNVEEYHFLCPPKETRKRIVSILSRYDSLIENYQKQIKLLEESAQRLYKEWFIDLRFPGYENTKIVDGVPEGWEKKKLGEIADINKRNIPKNHNLPYIDYTDLGSVRVGNIDNPFRYNTGEEPGRAKRVAIDGDIIWGMVRPNLKSYALIQYPQKYDVFSTGFAVLSATKVPFSFLYCALTTDSFVGYLMNCTNGAAYPAVKPEHFAAAKLLIPSLDCIEAFDLKIKLCFRKIHIIQTQIRHLTEARDRLLPKLMSGEIEV